MAIAARTETWRRVKLKDICDDITVGHVGPMADEYTEQGIPFLRSQNVQPFRIDLSAIKYISPAFHQRLRKSSLRPGDVVVVRTGYPGTASVIPNNLDVANCADLVIIRPSARIDSYFLTCIFNSTWGQGHVAGTLVGVAQQHFNIGAAREMTISIPPLPIQRKIAAILSAYDDLIENNTRRIALLEAMAQALYREWFVHFRFPGHQSVPMVDSPLGPIPQGWQVVKLGDVACINPDTIKRGQEPESIDYVDIASVSTGCIDKIETMSYEDAPGRARRKVKHGDVIWSTVRPNRKSYSLILNPPENMVVSTGFAVIRAINVPFTYLYEAVTTPDFVGYLTNRAKGSAYPAVTSEDFGDTDVALPPLDLLMHYHDAAVSMFELKQIALRSNETLRRTRDLLLPKLVSGEVDVSALKVALEKDGI